MCIRTSTFLLFPSRDAIEWHVHRHVKLSAIRMLSMDIFEYKTVKEYLHSVDNKKVFDRKERILAMLDYYVNSNSLDILYQLDYFVFSDNSIPLFTVYQKSAFEYRQQYEINDKEYDSANVYILECKLERLKEKKQKKCIFQK